MQLLHYSPVVIVIPSCVRLYVEITHELYYISVYHVYYEVFCGKVDNCGIHKSDYTWRDVGGMERFKFDRPRIICCAQPDTPA